jgi:ATP-binding cassette subfamily C (CFTR/MRP) protein 1
MNQSAVAPRCYNADTRFGPAISRNCRTFDFTLFFEQGFLSLTPSLLFVSISFLYLPVIARRPTKAYRDRLYGLKLVRRYVEVMETSRLTLSQIFAALYACLQLALIVLWSLPDAPRTGVSLPAVILSFIASISSCLLLHFDHIKSTQPSTLLSSFLFVSTIFDVVQTRTLWSLHHPSSISRVFVSALGVKTSLLLLEACGNQSSLLPSYRWAPPESLSNIYNRCLFWWLNTLFVRGFQKDLTLDTLFELDHKLNTARLALKSQESWDNVDKSNKYALGRSLLSCLAWPILIPVIPRLFLIGFSYSQPFLVTRLIDFLSDEKASSDGQNVGYGLIGATAIIYIGIAISNGRYKHSINRSMTMLRGALVSLLYHKTLELRSSAVEDSASSTLMSTDVDAVITASQQFHEIWGSAIEVTVGMYLLGRLVGVGAVAPVCLTLAGTVVNSFWIGPEMSRRRPEWNKAIQERIALTSTMLHDMKSLKMLGLVITLKKALQARRIEELKRSKEVRWMIVWMNAASNLMETFSPAFVLMTLSIHRTAAGETPLTASQAYTILSILSLVASPLSRVLSSIPAMIGCVGCLSRIQTYLLQESIKPYCLTGSVSRPSSDHSHTDGIAMQTLVAKTESGRPPKIVLDFKEVSLGYFSDSPVLRDITFQVGQGTMTMIVGPVGSGKSTLLLGVLGEIYIDHGNIRVADPNVAYCQQAAWLPNKTVKESIIGDAGLDQDWYRTAIHACCLDLDLTRVPGGENALIGSRGLTLSSGQRTRLALARTVYSRKPVVLLDDVFSDLDVRTQGAIFDRLFSPRGLFRRNNITVIMATHASKTHSL